MESITNEVIEYLDIGIPGVNPPRYLPVVSMFSPQPKVIKNYESEAGEEIVVEYNYQFTIPITRSPDQLPLGFHVYKNITEPYELITLRVGLASNSN